MQISRLLCGIEDTREASLLCESTYEVQTLNYQWKPDKKKIYYQN